ncbi:MAG: class I SAM-dependent methyltransferase [Nanoarchaeota archaeon]|nr:class I SAM-dependent methyltransferase [Nanoarchaeota archaeon]MBU1103969.1 class I SAM-dependent methyltransferase [Nanoarchaeota archaeon]
MITSKQFYTKLKPEGLAERKKVVHTKKELAYLKKLLNKKQKILDVGCGFGRFTIPLTKQGYKVEGVDITPTLIKRAKQLAKKEKLNIKFKIGDMRKLSYKKDSFDAIICMWSVFIELTKKSDQLKTIKEMLRVLKKKGFTLIEVRPSLKDDKFLVKKEGDEVKFNPKTKLISFKVSGIESVSHYIHNKKTFAELMKKAKIKEYKIFIDKFGGRDRMFLQFWKK